MKFLIVFSALICICCCHPYFRGFIPNGYTVPNPCANATGAQKIWYGVGHTNSSGGGPTNPFGQDFSDNEYSWTDDLCQKDSDGDGKTNGEELGDPECVWFNSPTSLKINPVAVSDPGVCEPMTSANCMTRNANAKILCP